jgi:hypothetical protein
MAACPLQAQPTTSPTLSQAARHTPPPCHHTCTSPTPPSVVLPARSRRTTRWSLAATTHGPQLYDAHKNNVQHKAGSWSPYLSFVLLLHCISPWFPREHYNLEFHLFPLSVLFVVHAFSLILLYLYWYWWGNQPQLERSRDYLIVSRIRHLESDSGIYFCAFFHIAVSGCSVVILFARLLYPLPLFMFSFVDCWRVDGIAYWDTIRWGAGTGTGTAFVE